jgi:hypothetical protein
LKEAKVNLIREEIEGFEKRYEMSSEDFMDKDGEMIFRYDNAPHHEVSTFPYHKHLPEGVKESKEKRITEVLKEIEMLVLKI